MPSNGVLVTPVELNRSLLNSLFKFKTDSKLHQFITKKTNQDKTIYTLAEVRRYYKSELDNKDILAGLDLLERYNQRGEIV